MKIKQYITIFFLAVIMTIIAPAQTVKQYRTGERNYELSNHIDNIVETVSDKKVLTNDGFVADVTSYSDYYPFGMQAVGRNGSAENYRYSSSGMEKDDEIKGAGNSLDFGARYYDPRLGRWVSMDAITKPYLTPYNYASNSPVIFIDPDGNTDYYFNGKKIGTDGVDNNLIGVVHDKKVAKDIKKTGDLSKITQIENGANFTGGFIIHKDILKSATDVADKAFSSKGKNREFATSLTKSADGKNYEAKDIVEGEEVDLSDPLATEAHVTVPKGDVSIHSHPTGYDEVSFDVTPSTKAEVGAGSDEEMFKDYKMNIVVGYSQQAKQEIINGVERFDQGNQVIQIYGDKIENKIGGLSRKDAEKIIEDQGL